MSQINSICANCASPHETAACDFPSYTVEGNFAHTPRSAKPKLEMHDPLDTNRLMTQQSPNDPNLLNALGAASDSGGITVTDRTTYTFNFCATPTVPIMANYVNANLLCADLRKWGSEMEEWAMGFQRFITEMDEIVKLPCFPHFMIDQHGFTIEMKLPTGLVFEAEVQRALERGMARFTEGSKVRIASGGVEIGQYSMRTQQPAIRHPVLQQHAVLQHPELLEDRSPAPILEGAIATGSPLPKKRGRGRGGNAAGRGRGGGEISARVAKIKKEPVEKKKKTTFKKNTAKKTSQTLTTEKTEVPTANIVVVPEECNILVPKVHANAEVESVDENAELEAILAFEVA